MNNVIDVNDIQTYPDEIIQSFKLDVADIDCDKLFENYSFKCCHVCCTSNIENYKKYGIIRPFVVNNDGTIKINYILKNIILKPLTNDINYSYYCNKYDELLINEYEKNKNIDRINNWFGKYSCVCYTMDNLNNIVPENSCYEPLLRFYGGEIFRDIGVSADFAEDIGNKYKAYAIFFKLSYKELICKCILIEDIYKHMKKIYSIGKSEYGFENNINKDIPPSDIIEICEVKKYD